MKNASALLQDPILKRFFQEAADLKREVKAVYLFGSRARGDERPDSDYDLLLVVPRIDQKLKDRLYDIVLDILLDTGKLISLKFHKAKEFDRLMQIPTPFMERLQKEGIKVG